MHISATESPRSTAPMHISAASARRPCSEPGRGTSVALRTVPRLSPRVAAGALLVVWLGYFTALQWSVVRYRLAIVVVLTSAAVLLGTAQLRGWRLERLPGPLLAG